MNIDDIPAGPKLDGLVYERFVHPDIAPGWAQRSAELGWDPSPRYSTDIRDAGSLLPKMRRNLEITCLSDVAFWHVSWGYPKKVSAMGETLMVAICRAALKGVEQTLQKCERCKGPSRGFNNLLCEECESAARRKEEEDLRIP